MIVRSPAEAPNSASARDVNGVRPRIRASARSRRRQELSSRSLLSLSCTLCSTKPATPTTSTHQACRPPLKPSRTSSRRTTRRPSPSPASSTVATSPTRPRPRSPRAATTRALPVSSAPCPVRSSPSPSPHRAEARRRELTLSHRSLADTPVDDVLANGTPYKPVGKFEGRVWLITGGDSGIGRATAILAALEGANVCVPLSLSSLLLSRSRS